MATQFTHTMDGAVRSGASGGLSALVHWFGRLLHDVQRRRQAHAPNGHRIGRKDEAFAPQGRALRRRRVVYRERHVIMMPQWKKRGSGRERPV